MNNNTFQCVNSPSCIYYTNLASCYFGDSDVDIANLIILMVPLYMDEGEEDLVALGEFGGNACNRFF
jgi:hypothetical protein